jgi:exodeoxyribonuclease-5
MEPLPEFSDEPQVRSLIASALGGDGQPDRGGVFAVLGRAGTGKTKLLTGIVAMLKDRGFRAVSADEPGAAAPEERSFAVLAPTNKAAAVLRTRGVAAATIHRILYTPEYDPGFEKIAAWLTGRGQRPVGSALTDEALDRALRFYQAQGSVPAALAAAGLRGSDFITGWKRRDDPLDIGLVDEASMLDDSMLKDLREIFPTLILFGDPAQLAPVGQSGSMCFRALPERAKATLTHIHRQEADSPIITLAHALSDPDLGFSEFERLVVREAARDARVILAPRADAALMARSPILCWRNATRIRLIQAFRSAFGAPQNDLLPGEPLICDGFELPLKQRRKRIDLEVRGLIKGAQTIYLGPGKKASFSRVHVIGAEEPQVGVASIIKIEKPGDEEPFIPYAANMGAVFVHGAASTIHKAQGSQWPEVQVFAPDLLAASFSGLEEDGLPLWKRLAYVAITRAEERLIWVTRAMLALPKAPLGIDDLPRAGANLALEQVEKAR